MALTVPQLEAKRDALQAALYSGVRSVHFQDRRIDYTTTDEMRNALSDLDQQIKTLQSTIASRRSYAAFSK